MHFQKEVCYTNLLQIIPDHENIGLGVKLKQFFIIIFELLPLDIALHNRSINVRLGAV